MAAEWRKLTRGRRRPAVRALLTLASVLLLSSCATLERQGAVPEEPAAAPAAAPKTLAESPGGAERKKLVALYGGDYHWPKAEAYLNAVLVRLAKASETPGQPYRVTILNSGVVNAFALPSGDLFITRGLLALANDMSEVAAVMAHEIAHVTARHAFLRAEQEKKAALIAQAARVIQSQQKGAEVEASSAMNIAGFSRAQELEADRVGIGVTARAGYDPFGAARFLNSLARSSALRASLIGQKGSDKPDILATHPSNSRANRGRSPGGAADRRTGNRGNRRPGLSGVDRRHGLRRRSDGRGDTRPQVHSSAVGLCHRGA